MASIVADRVFEKTTFVGGVGAISLSVSAETGYQTFLSGWGASGTGWYCLVLGSQWETGYGTLNAGGTTLTRTKPLNGSSGTGVAVSFSAGTIDCFGTLPAAAAGYLTLSITGFGGIGDGFTDNTAALNAALSSLSGRGGSIVFPAGTFRFNSQINFNLLSGIFSVSLIGQGQDATILYWPNPSGGIVFNYSGSLSSVHVSDMSFTTGADGTISGIALELVGNVTEPNYTQSDVTRVTMRSESGHLGASCWAAGLAIYGVSNVNVDGLLVSGDGSLLKGVGIDFNGLISLSAYAAALNIGMSSFIGLNIGIHYGDLAQGVTIDQSNFYACQYGILASATTPGTFGLDQLVVTNSAFNNRVSSIHLQTTVNNVFISNNYFITIFDNQATVYLVFVGWFSVTNNSFFGGAGTNTTGIVVGTNSDSGIISGNLVRGYSAAGILLQAPSTRVSVESNILSANAISILDAAAAASPAGTNIIQNNPGYNPVGNGGNITVGSSPFTYTAGSSPETIYIRTAGLVDLVTLHGLAIAANVGAFVPITVQLAPYESFIVTYSGGTPTLAKIIK